MEWALPQNRISSRRYRLFSFDVRQFRDRGRLLPSPLLALLFGVISLGPAFATEMLLSRFYGDLHLGFHSHTGFFLAVSFGAAALSIFSAHSLASSYVESIHDYQSYIRVQLHDRETEFFEEIEGMLEEAIEPADSRVGAMA
jgi:hypothetical protein